MGTGAAATVAQSASPQRGPRVARSCSGRKGWGAARRAAEEGRVINGEPCVATGTIKAREEPSDGLNSALVQL